MGRYSNAARKIISDTLESMNSHRQPEPLDYRFPGTPGSGADLVFRWLCTRHCLGVAGAVFGIAVGVLVVIGAGWVVSVLFAWIFERVVSTAGSTAVFWMTFAGYVVIVLPILTWRTIRTGGEFYSDQVLESNVFHGEPVSYSSWAYRSNVASVALHIDLLFWGPRLIVDGASRLLGRDVVRSVVTLRRATYVLTHLLRAGKSVRTKALRIPTEPKSDLLRVLNWLTEHDYVGMSADRQRVWLASNARESLSLMLQLEPARRLRQGPLPSAQGKPRIAPQAGIRGISTTASIDILAAPVRRGPRQPRR